MNDLTANGNISPDPSSQLILMVDDEPEILEEYQEFLEYKGFQALIESDSERAFETVLARPDIALVVTDFRMAKLDGPGLINKLRAALPAGRCPAFIMLTGVATFEIDEQRLGAPVLFKPVDFDALVAAVTDALSAPSRTPSADLPA